MICGIEVCKDDAVNLQCIRHAYLNGQASERSIFSVAASKMRLTILGLGFRLVLA